MQHITLSVIFFHLMYLYTILLLCIPIDTNMPVTCADIQHNYNHFNQQANIYANIEILRVNLHIK